MSKPDIYAYRNESLSSEDIIPIHFGNLKCLYWKGSLRKIMLGSTEIIRMIAPAVRNKDWQTAPFTIIDEKIIQEKDGFSIHLQCKYVMGPLKYHACLGIEGTRDSIIFNMKGMAGSTFLKNRIGLNVLHPIKECAGRPCKVTTKSGSTYEASFPDQISPHQPIKEIAVLRWSPVDQVSLELEFSGDTFEMEDHRNWTDASFKIYSTPLDLPFPVRINKGERLEQEVRLKVSAPDDVPVEKKDVFTFHLNKEAPESSFPAIGIGRSSEVNKLTGKDVHNLKYIAFSHYRLDIDLSQPAWVEELDRGAREAESLELSLELALFFDQKMELITSPVIEKISRLSVNVVRIMIFTRDHLNSEMLTETVIPHFNLRFPNIPIGTGTNANFAELNRNRPVMDLPDFISYAITPQVHAFDPLSMVENLEAQADTVRDAYQFSFGKPVVVSPVTLRPRFNAVATSHEEIPKDEKILPWRIDPRQVTFFCAGWTLGSLKYLAESGVSAITFYETIGREGILHGDHDPLTPDLYPANRGDIYPVYYLFRELLKYRKSKVIPTFSSHPHIFSTLILDLNNQKILAVANHTSYDIEIGLPGFMKMAKQWKLDAETLEIHREAEFEWKTLSQGRSLKLTPESISLFKVIF